jgi:hypothetical protein
MKAIAGVSSVLALGVMLGGGCANAGSGCPAGTHAENSSGNLSIVNCVDD